MVGSTYQPVQQAVVPPLSGQTRGVHQNMLSSYCPSKQRRCPQCGIFAGCNLRLDGRFLSLRRGFLRLAGNCPGERRNRIWSAAKWEQASNYLFFFFFGRKKKP